MESWSVGFEGDADVERHADVAKVRVAKPRLRLRMVSDYICPWCYVGLARVEQLGAEFDLEFEPWAFELRPGIPPEGITREEASRGRTYPAGYVNNLRQTALDAGIDMKRPPVVPNTRKAHEATEFAKEYGHLGELHHALFRAYFEDERNIGDVDVLCDIASSVGLDAGELREALDSGRYAAAVEEQIEWGRAAGISGVPTVIFNDRFALVGAQEYDVFRDVASRVLRGAVPEG